MRSFFVHERVEGAELLRLATLSLMLLAVFSSLVFGQPKPVSAPEEPPAVAADNGLYDIDATGTDVKFVLEALARRSGANIVVSPEITGEISAHLKQQSVDSILDFLSAVQGFAWKKSGDTYLVSTKERLLAKPAEVLEPLPEPQTLVWKCRHAKPSGLVTVIAKMFPGVKAAEGPNQSDPKLGAAPSSAGASLGSAGGSPGLSSSNELSDSGSLVVMGQPDELAKVKELLERLDAPPMQVSIEVAITEVTSSAGKTLGIDWSWSDLAIKESAPSGIGFGKFSRSGMSIAGAIKALLETSGAKLLAQPNIAVLDGANAEILIGDRILFPKLVGYNQIGAPIYDKDEERVGIYLQLAVRVTDDDHVIMTLYPQVSLITKYLTTSAGSYPQISTREARTTVSVKNGTTLAIGGLLKDNDIVEGASIPLLGKLPIIGGLFRRTKTTKEHSELVIFLTPKIVKQG